jgi:hypothetical protein
MATVAVGDEPSPALVAQCGFFGVSAFLCCRPWRRGSPAVTIGLAHVMARLVVEAILVIVDSLVAWFWNGYFVIFFCLSALFSVPRALAYAWQLSRSPTIPGQSGRILLVLLACGLRIAGCAMTMITLSWTVGMPPPGTTQSEFTSIFSLGCAVYGGGVLLELATWRSLLTEQPTDELAELPSGPV